MTLGYCPQADSNLPLIDLKLLDFINFVNKNLMGQEELDKQYFVVSLTKTGGRFS